MIRDPPESTLFPYPPLFRSQSGPDRPQYHGVPANALPLTASEDRQWATLSHFGGILGCVPALLIYLIFKDRGPFTAQEDRKSTRLNSSHANISYAVFCLKKK